MNYDVVDKKTGEVLCHVIDLSPIFDFCCLCDAEVEIEYGLAMYEDELLPYDWPGEWAGFTACQRCYEAFTEITEPLTRSKARAILSQSQ